MKTLPNSIHLRNPRVRDVVAQETEAGYGRSLTETAENLILEAAERRRNERRFEPATATRLPVTDGPRPFPT